MLLVGLTPWLSIRHVGEGTLVRTVSRWLVGWLASTHGIVQVHLAHKLGFVSAIEDGAEAFPGGLWCRQLDGDDPGVHLLAYWMAPGLDV